MDSRAPGRFEFEFLQFLSENPGLSSRQVYEIFGQPRGYVRGTVVKAIDRLFKKGQLKRESCDAGFVYSVAPAATTSHRELVEAFVRDRLQGRIAPLFAFFAEAERLDAAQRKELRDLLERLDGQDK